MKMRYLISIMALLLAVSCVKENSLVEREQILISRFEFPQGDSPSDKKLVDMYNKLGVRCIYKDITLEDLNKSWNVGTIDGAGMKGESLSDATMVDFYVSFFCDNIFRYFDKKMTIGIFPANIYFVQNYYNSKANPLYGAMPNAPEYYGEARPRVFNGLDFWGFCFAIEEYYTMAGFKQTLKFPVTVLDYKKLKEPILKNIIDIMIKRKRILDPTFLSYGIATDLNYQTPVKSSNTDINNVDYYKRRGFPETFRNLDTYVASSAVNNIGSGTTMRVNVTPSQLFVDYLWLGLRYTKEQIELNYVDFPIVIKYYNLVAEYMLSSYNINLNAMAQDPELISGELKN